MKTYCFWCKKYPEETPEGYLIEISNGKYTCQSCQDILFNHVFPKDMDDKPFNPSRRE